MAFGDLKDLVHAVAVESCPLYVVMAGLCPVKVDCFASVADTERAACIGTRSGQQ